MRLSELPFHTKSKINKFENEQLAAKLLEMGFLPGSEIEVIRTAPMGCPLYVKVSNQRLALRRKDAEHVILQ